MYLLYLDASGTADPRDHSTHYVLGGLCMREGSWFGLDKRVRALKRRYRYGEMDFELHVKQFAVTIREQDEIDDFDRLTGDTARAAPDQAAMRNGSSKVCSRNSTATTIGSCTDCGITWHRERARASFAGNAVTRLTNE